MVSVSRSAVTRGMACVPIGFLVTSRSIFDTQTAIGRSIGFSAGRPRIACISSANLGQAFDLGLNRGTRAL